MTIISPDRTPAATIAGRAARGVELEAAREAAGLTVEGLARRCVTVSRLRFPGDGILSEHDERNYVPHMARAFDFMERVSQSTYDRTVAWYASTEEKDRKRRPRIHLPHYDEAFSAIALGHAEATLDELRDALATVRTAEEAERRKTTRQTLNERAAAVARLRATIRVESPHRTNQASWGYQEESGLRRHPGRIA